MSKEKYSFIVVKYHKRETAEEALTAVRELAKEKVLKLKDAALAERRNKDIGFVFQLHHLLPQCTVLENVLVPTLVAKTTENAEDRATAEATSLPQVAEYVERIGGSDIGQITKGFRRDALERNE